MSRFNEQNERHWCWHRYELLAKKVNKHFAIYHVLDMEMFGEIYTALMDSPTVLGVGGFWTNVNQEVIDFLVMRLSVDVLLQEMRKRRDIFHKAA